MIIELTKESFEQEVLKADKPVLVKFYAKSGCPACTSFLPKFEAFAAKHPEIKCCAYGKETLKEPLDEIEQKYSVSRFPTVIAFENGEELTKDVGNNLTPERMVSMLKTIQNVSDEELVETKLDFEIALAKKKKEMFEIERAINNINAEYELRLLKRKEPVHPAVPATETPVPAVPATPVIPNAIQKKEVPDLPADPALETGCDGCQ